MPVFADATQLYRCTEELFARVQEQDPQATDTILASRLVIRLRSKAPDAEITMDGRRRPVQTTFGPSPLRPTLDIELAGDTLHRVLSGTLSLKQAVANGLLKVQGPVWKTQALADLFRHGQAIYPQLRCGRAPASE
jgi:hypothetical protein